MPNGKLSKPASTVLVRVINPAQVSSPFDSIQVHRQNPDSAIKHGFLSPSDISDRCYSPILLCHTACRQVDGAGNAESRVNPIVGSDYPAAAAPLHHEVPLELSAHDTQGLTSCLHHCVGCYRVADKVSDPAINDRWTVLFAWVDECREYSAAHSQTLVVDYRSLIHCYSLGSRPCDSVQPAGHDSVIPQCSTNVDPTTTTADMGALDSVFHFRRDAAGIP
ncbi:uncharacterized protein BO96DRAFT_349766 [Aspergillus niger CBS 101883]|uniref:Uncharacterized protein n=2 Tax=Aspergillus niger TaxID=5061 RepID=A2QY03_ASPNC|nr:uncharacterized protein BO96DRAFT_349766 [Aspergillus niger CBS 101883]XP_059601698.1 hypothetical protein An11g10850 [Aspergillus niger]PYH51618.1 hypothetical protein BO96DRAFT_349766 [Aspergillus niger CBS 101883]CAK40883.1 hypothetical protein An11g10850 [Aspergillus niger]